MGIALLGTAALALSGRGARVVLQVVAASAVLVGIALLANFELANGGSFGLGLASDSFDEGVDLDTVLIAVQLALVVGAAPALRAAWAARPLPLRAFGRHIRPATTPG